MNEPILVIEDNDLNRELVTDLLEANSFIVYQAREAEQGLRLAREYMPDLVLMDLSLPGMDGLAATRALREDPAIQHLTVIALTAHAMKGDEQTALRAGCDRSEEHTSELQSQSNLVCRLLLEKKKTKKLKTH